MNYHDISYSNKFTFPHINCPRVLPVFSDCKNSYRRNKIGGTVPKHLLSSDPGENREIGKKRKWNDIIMAGVYR